VSGLEGLARSCATVADLVASSGIAFADRGTHALEGVPNQWQLFAVESSALGSEAADESAMHDEETHRMTTRISCPALIQMQPNAHISVGCDGDLEWRSVSRTSPDRTRDDAGQSLS
jgi:hypothetical protein